ncbi:MAG: DUF934 domain-containing protein [Geminicoccaceae bacterium]
MPIVNDQGFGLDEAIAFTAHDDLDDQPKHRAIAVDLPNDRDPADLAPNFERIALIRIPFPSFADGRGFSVAKRLRSLGYRGRLRAHGHVIADQYGLARSCGFDEIEIDDALAARQTEKQWRDAARRPRTSYRDKYRKGAGPA